MRVGLIARGEDRGLGIQTWEWARHMDPDAVLLVDMGDAAGGYPIHHDRYDQARTTVAKFDRDHFVDRATVRAWVESVDVIYCAETWYDQQMPEWCHEAGVGLVCHVNPEFFHHSGRWLPAVTWWLPTSWRQLHLPRAAVLVPVPVPLERWPEPQPLRDDPPVYLHVAGKRAAGDRNGTSLFMSALARTNAAMTVRVVTQDARLPQVRTGRNVTLEPSTGGVVDYWRLYDGHDVLVMPRRYGGLCLPAHEAAGAGLGLVMTATSPNPSTWPCAGIAATGTSHLAAPAGTVTTTNADPHAIAAWLDTLAIDTVARHGLQVAARRWAERHSWAALAPTIRQRLEAACR